MSKRQGKRAGVFYSQEYLKEGSKKPKLTEVTNFIYGIPVLKLGDDWYVHRASLEDYFNLECIDDDTRKVSILIASLKKETYQTMRNLCKPELPNQKTFEQLCEIMEKHYLEILVLKMRISQFTAIKFRICNSVV